MPDFSKPPPGFPLQIQPQIQQTPKVLLNPAAPAFQPKNGTADVTTKKSDVTNIKRTVKVERKVETERKVVRSVEKKN